MTIALRKTFARRKPAKAAPARARRKSSIVQLKRLPGMGSDTYFGKTRYTGK
ncbi:MAG TPA: hypothetical protein VM008_09885 [Phycisphaerae bacterium]|nr:hypothetical protein [Phycisphaerae bacterium]